MCREVVMESWLHPMYWTSYLRVWKLIPYLPARVLSVLTKFMSVPRCIRNLFSAFDFIILEKENPNTAILLCKGLYVENWFIFWARVSSKNPCQFYLFNCLALMKWSITLSVKYCCFHFGVVSEIGVTEAMSCQLPVRFNTLFCLPYRHSWQ